MQTITTYDAHCGTAVKHEQPGSCSTILGNKNNRTNHGGGIARRLMPLLLFIFALVGGTAWGQVTYTYTTGTDATHTVSEGVDYVIIEAIGGGGAGGSVTGNGDRPAGGGGGGAYSRVEVDVSVLGNSRQISYTVGAGGTAYTAGTNSVNGGTTTVSFGEYTLTANGGKSAAAVTNSNYGSGEKGGATTSITGTGTGTGISNYNSYAGGKGAAGNESWSYNTGTTRYSGGGGGAAGSNGAGNAANGRSGGRAQSPGGYGANGLTQNSNGTTGGNFGGGGSGAYYYSNNIGSVNSDYTGGAGASGAVIITEYYSTSNSGVNPDIVSRGSNIESMEIDVVANDFISCPNNYIINIVENSAVNCTVARTLDGKKVSVTFPPTYNAANSSFQYYITCGEEETATPDNDDMATVIIQNSTVVANLGCPDTTKDGNTIDYYSFPDVEIIGDENNVKIQYMSLAFTNVPDIENVAGYSFTVSSESKFVINSNGIYYNENGTNTKIGDTINFGKFMLACHFNVGSGIAMSLAKDLIKAIEVRIPESNSDETATNAEDFVGVELEISTNYGGRTIIYNAENGHYYEYVPGGIDWTEAYEAAKGTYYLGMQGYLATITSQEENRFMTALVHEPGWLGGTRMPNSDVDPNNPLYYSGFDTEADNDELQQPWYWACGPEIGQPFMDQIIATVNGGTSGGYPSGTNLNPRPTGNDLTTLRDWYNSYMTRTGYYFNWGTGHSDATAGPEPNNAYNGNNNGNESCLSVLYNKGYGCDFVGTAFELYSWNDLRNTSGGSDDWDATGYIIEYGDLPTGNSFPPLHDGFKCRSIVGLTKEIITAEVTSTEVQCSGGNASLAVTVEFTGGLAPYSFKIYDENNNIQDSYTTNGAITFYLPISETEKNWL